ncbi:MAG TPA: DUF6101 family protein [Pseudolabrys sp.]|jgi:hypothetical protein|nr:DUF6101 family protein [Pseudolabrys sp.]
MRSGGCSAGSSRVERLDPFALPVRFAASDTAADERVRHIELHRERVVVRRTLAGMRMALNMPVSAFAGIGLEITETASGFAASVLLAHSDPGLALPLFVTRDAEEALADWRTWGAVFGLPLLLRQEDGNWREPFARLGGVRVLRAKPRRRRKSPLNRRRPRMPLRRRAGRTTGVMPIHRGEREIIARS